ncbi:MAG: dNTP triphosphohydrolase [Opitutaceae bacterium]
MAQTNRFYRPFDFECLPGRRPDDYRNAFQVDRDRIIYSSAFRRLQSKTQVFVSGEFDFYRTRLTHSIEVAQIGRSICQFLQVQGKPMADDFYIDSDLVEAICLAHDLGHPPYGHAGERKLHDLMRTDGGFEGNAQTVRQLADILYLTETGMNGMSPTRAFLDGVMKYKHLLCEFDDPEHHFLYSDQRNLRGFVFGEREVPGDLMAGRRLNHLKSIECQIMDWADDTAYSLNDIIDGVRAGFLTFEKIESWAAQRDLSDRDLKRIDDLMEAVLADKLEAVFSLKIGQAIRACRLVPRESFLSDLSNRHAFGLEVEPEVEEEATFFKEMAVDIIFRSPQLQQMEFRGGAILGRIWEALVEHYIEAPRRPLRILPRAVAALLSRLETGAERKRILCDHLAGMTDGAAMRTYRRLTDPDFSSIIDLG